MYVHSGSGILELEKMKPCSYFTSLWSQKGTQRRILSSFGLQEDLVVAIFMPSFLKSVPEDNMRQCFNVEF